MEFGQKVGRRVGSTIALGVTTLGVMAIPMLLSKKKKHYLTIGFKEPDGSGGAIVLELSKSTVRTIIPTLEARTGKKVEQEEGEEGAARQAQARGPAGREPSDSDTAAQGKATTAATPAASAAPLSIPPDTGVKPETPPDARPTKLSSARSNSPVSPPAQASLNITSAPLSADIQLNGKFVGNAPSVLKVNPGSYKILVTKSGFKDWEREIVVGAGDSISLNAELGAATFHAVPSAPPIPAASARPNPPSPAPGSARAAVVLPSISLESTPSSAAVSLDGRLIGETPLRIRLDAGSHALTVQKQGYRPWVENIEIPAGSSMEIVADLQVAVEQAPNVIFVPPKRGQKSGKK